MSDRLEDFIKQNRPSFDLEEPGGHLWKAIEADLPNKKNKLRLISRITGIAASILIVLSAGYFIGARQQSGQLSQDVFASEQQYQEFQEAQQYYISTIQDKMDKVEDMGAEEETLNDLKQLDEIYEELKAELLKNQYKDKDYLINLMINNYKTKIGILERIIEKSEQQNEQKIEENETINI